MLSNPPEEGLTEADAADWVQQRRETLEGASHCVAPRCAAPNHSPPHRPESLWTAHPSSVLGCGRGLRPKCVGLHRRVRAAREVSVTGSVRGGCLGGGGDRHGMDEQLPATHARGPCALAAATPVTHCRRQPRIRHSCYILANRSVALTTCSDWFGLAPARRRRRRRRRAVKGESGQIAIQQAIVDGFNSFVGPLIKHVALVDAARQEDGPNAVCAAAALRFLGFATTIEACAAAIPAVEQRTVMERLLENLRGFEVRGKSTMIYTVWTISTQRFSAEIVEPFIPRVTNALQALNDSAFGQSSTISQESLFCLTRLLDVAPATVRSQVASWAFIPVRLLVFEALRVREKAKELVAALLPMLCEYFKGAEPSRQLTRELEAVLLPKLKRVYADPTHRVFALDVWSSFVRMLGGTIPTNVLNGLTSVIADAFTDTPDVAIAGYDSWGVLITALCSGSLAKKRRDMLLKPLTRRAKGLLASHEKVQYHRRLAWWCLARGVVGTGATDPQDLKEQFSSVCIPLLESSFDVIGEGPSLQTLPGLRGFGCHALAQLLSTDGHRHGGSLEPLRVPMPAKGMAIVLLPKLPFLLQCIRAGLADRDTEEAAVETVSSLCQRLQILSGGAALTESTAAGVRDVIKLLVGAIGDESLHMTAACSVGMLDAVQKNSSARMLTSQLCRVSLPAETVALSPIHVLFRCYCTLATTRAVAEAEVESAQLPGLFARLTTSALLAPNPLRSVQLCIAELSEASKTSLDQVGDAASIAILSRSWQIGANLVQAHIEKTGVVSSGVNQFNPNYEAIIAVLAIPAVQLAAGTDCAGEGSKTREIWAGLFKSFASAASLAAASPGNLHVEKVAAVVYATFTSSGGAVLKRATAMPLVALVLPALLEAVSYDGRARSSNRSSSAKSSRAASVHALFKLVGLVLSRMREHMSPGSAPAVSSACVSTLGHLRAALQRVKDDAMAAEIMSCLAGPIGLLLSEPAAGAAAAPSAPPKEHTKAIAALWQATADLVERHPTDFDSDSLERMVPIFKSTLRHSQRTVRQRSRDLWNQTFGSAVWLSYPESLKTAIASIRRESPKTLSLPGWVDGDPSQALGSAAITDDAVISPTAQNSSESQMSVVQLPRFRNKAQARNKHSFLRRGQPDAMKPASRKRPAQPGQESPKPSPKSDSGPQTPVLKRVEPSPKKPKLVMTPHQKETRASRRLKRKEQLAMISTLVGGDDQDAELADEETQSPPIEGGFKPPAQLGMAAGTGPGLGALADAGNAPAAQLSLSPQSVASTPASILKRRPMAGISASKKSKARRVSFDLEANTNHLVEKVPRGLAARHIVQFVKGGNFRGFAASADQRKKRPGKSPPPKTGAAPSKARSGAAYARSRVATIQQFVAAQGRSPSKRKLVSPSLVHPSNESPATETSVSRTAKRSLDLGPSGASRVGGAGEELKKLRADDAPVFPDLIGCRNRVAEVLQFFHLSNRRAVGQLLAGKRVCTVGDLCALTPLQMVKLSMSPTDDTIAQLETYLAKVATKRKPATSPLGRSEPGPGRFTSSLLGPAPRIGGSTKTTAGPASLPESIEDSSDVVM